MIIETPDPATATGTVAEMYADDLDTDGLVYAHTRAMAVNPEAHDAFIALIRAVVPSIGVRAYELATLAAARAIGSGHCLLAHGRKTLDAGLMDDSQLQRLVADHRDADLSAAEVALMAYCEKLSTDSAAMTDADSQSLRDTGWTDRQIVDITLAAAARNFFSRSLQALAVPLDDVPRLDPATAAALLAPTRRD